MDREGRIHEAMKAVEKARDALWELEERLAALREDAKEDIGIIQDGLEIAIEKVQKDKRRIFKKFKKFLHKYFPIYYEETMDDGSVKRIQFK